MVAAGAGESALKDAASTTREISDVTGDLVGHHERQVGVRTLDFGLGLRLGTGVGGGRHSVGLVDGRGFSLLLLILLRLLRTLSSVGTSRVKFVHALDDAVKFLLQAIVGAYVEIAAQQRVDGSVEILFGLFGFARVIVGEAVLVFLFNARDQIGDGIGNWC